MAENLQDDPRPQPPVFTQKPPIQSDFTTTTTDGKGNSRSKLNAQAFKVAQDNFLAAQRTHEQNLSYYREHELPGWESRQQVRGAGQATANAEAARQQKAQADYQSGPDAKTMTAYKTWAMPAGTLAGGLEGHVFGRGMSGVKTGYGLPEGQSAFQGTASKRATMMAPPALVAGLGLAKAYDLYHDANDPNATPYDRDYAKAGMNALVGQSAGALGAGSIHALQDIGGPNSLSGGLPPKGEVPSPAAPAAPPPPPPPAEPPLDLKGKTPTEASREILTKIGITPAATLKENKLLIEKGIPRSDPAIKAAIAASHPAFDPENLGPSIVQRLSKTGAAAKLAVPLGILGAGAGASMLSSDASAGPARDESLIGYRLRRAGDVADTASAYLAPELRPDLAWKTGMGLGEAAKGLAGRLDPPKSVIDMPPPAPSRTPAFPSPNSPKGMADAARYAPALGENARQRAEPVSRREDIGADAANAAPQNGGVSDYRDIGKGPVALRTQPSAFVPGPAMGFDPQHLPDYERDLHERGVSPAEAAMHLMPHARAGAEAVRRGEDFWGGTDQYERERTALQAFYGAANRAAQNAIGSPLPRDDAASGEDRARGGRVRYR